MTVEQPLDIQLPEEHEPTLEELMQDIKQTIEAKDATIEKDRLELQSTKLLLESERIKIDNARSILKDIVATYRGNNA